MRHFFSMTTALVIIIPLVAGAALLRVFQISQAEQAILRRYALVTEQTLRAERLNAEGERLARLSRSYLLTPHPDIMKEVDTSRARFDGLARQLAEAHLDERERELMEEISRADRFLRSIARDLHQQRGEGVPVEELQPPLTGEYQFLREALDETLRELLHHERERMSALESEAHQVLAESGGMRLFAVIVAVIMLALQAVLAMRELHRRRLAQEMAESNAAERAASEARYSGIVSLAADAIITVDEAQRITLFNAGAETIFGYQAAEVLGRPLDVLMPERLRERHHQFLRTFVEKGLAARRIGERQRVHGLRKSGEEFPIDAAISSLEVEGKRTLTVILRDISEQKRVEEEQRFLVSAGELLSSTSLDSERTLSRVAQLAVERLADWCLVCLCDEGRVRLSEVVHRDPAQWQTASLLRGFPLDSRRAFLAREVLVQRKPLLQSHVSAEQLAALAQSDDHLLLLRRLNVRSFMAVPLMANERLLGTLTFISSDSGHVYTPRDLEFAEQLGRYSSLALENARLYQSARDATLARDKILGVVAHDLRSPLQSILLALPMLQRRAPVPGGVNDERQGKLLERLSTSAHRMNRMIEDLLDVARVEAGQLSIRASPQPTEPLLHEALETVRPQAQQIQLVLEPPGSLPPVLADRDRLLQVFSNLLGNALKFTPSGGEVRVGAHAKDGQVVFFVKDTGPGLTAEARQHLFERFWQANHGDRRGAGLGLSIVKDIIEAHGGRIHVESEQGQGSSFFFSVPIALNATPSPPGPLDTAGPL
ncbi:sensor histidine kinase [Cystobacter ferrugineus]|nr:ATP-binding protein [Cystobacter ferrugineus]